jgi:hypothetical protein
MGQHQKPKDPEFPTGEFPPEAFTESPKGVSVTGHWPVHSLVISSTDLMTERVPRDAAYTFLEACGLEPTPDAVGQLVEAFLPCLRKMCDSDHPWDPDGRTWRESGSMGALSDARKKFKRLWYRAWIMKAPHDDPAAVDSAVDGINFFGFWLRSDDDGWNEWGEPGSGKHDA